MNKHILSVFTILGFAVSVAAQNFTLYYPATVFTGPHNQLLEAPVTVTNISGADLNMLVIRKTNNVATGHDSYFCWSINCYGPTTSISTDTLQLASGAIDQSFKGYLSPTSGTPGTSVVEYCFFDYNTPNDSVCVEFTYIIEITSVDEVNNENTFSLPYPNPSNQIVTFRYDIKSYKTGSVRIHDILGRGVKEVQLTDKQGVILIPVKDLNAGVYFASIIADGKKIVTRRLVISHK
ncbi:MAG: T9SS type A sorting domain-containing protein [Bacteroidia bacterium]